MYNVHSHTYATLPFITEALHLVTRVQLLLMTVTVIYVQVMYTMLDYSYWAMHFNSKGMPTIEMTAAAI